MEISAADNNNDQITMLEVSAHLRGHPGSPLQPGTSPINLLIERNVDSCLAPPGGTMKSLQSTKSKKSLKSIVDRLSKQYIPINTDSQQFMAALSLKETSTSSQVLSAQVHNFYQAPADEALDLSIKRGPYGGQQYLSEGSFPTKTDSVGALDLSVSTSRSRTVEQEISSGTPDFVLDLTKPSPTESDNNRPNWGVKSQNDFQTFVTPPKGLPKNEQDDFQANHVRVLQFLSHHTIQQKVRGSDVDIELLTCRYCKYASTEKSCMMAHLTTTHVSKKHSGSSRMHQPPYQQMELKTERHRQPSQSNGNVSRQLSRKPKSDSPRLVMIKNDQGSYSPQVIQVMDHNNQVQQTFLPASLVELAAQSSLPSAKGPHNSPRYDHSPKKSSRVAKNTSPQRRRSKHLYDSQRTLSRHHMPTREGVYFVPYHQVGSILEERLTSNQANVSPNLPSTSGSCDPKVPKSSKTENISSSEEQQRLKLDHLCTRLAGRMGARNHRGKVQHRRQSQGVEDGHRAAAKNRRRKSSGGKRQSLIAQTGNFSCEYCAKTFKRPLSLYGHLKQHSPLLKKHRKGLFQCRTCPLTFSSFPDLLQHTQCKHSQSQSASEVHEGSSPNCKGVASQQGSSFSTEGPVVQRLPAMPMEKKYGRGRKSKPYSLRDQVRRDYLLDHDPMIDQKDASFVPSLEEKLTSNQNRTDQNLNNLPEKIVPKRQKVTHQMLFRDVKALIKLKEKKQKKKNIKVTGKPSSRYAPGVSWKRVLRKFKEKSSRQHLQNVLCYVVRRPKNVQCKVCNATAGTFWKALLHLEKKHLKDLCNDKSVDEESKPKGTVVTNSPVKTEVDSRPRSSADSGLYVKMPGSGGEQYQCNLCLQLFKGRDKLIEHLEMHKQIYEEGMRSFSSKSEEGSGKRRKVNSRDVTPTDTSAIQGEVESSLGESQAIETIKRSTNLPSSPFVNLKMQRKDSEEVKSKHKTESKPSQHSQSNPEMHVIQQKKKQGSPSKGQQLRKHLFGRFAQDGIKSKKFLCKICMYPSFTMDDMRRHMRKHCKTLLNCDQCSYQTIERRFIVRHIQTVHEQRRPYTCELCVYSTAYKHHLRRHYKSHSVDLLSCSMCSFCTLQESKFQEHKREHDLSPNIVMCDDCGLTFANDKLLKEHRAETHKKEPSEEEEEVVAGASSEPKDPAGFNANWWENISTAALDNEAIFERHRCESCGFFAEDSDTLMSHMTDKHLDSVVAFQEEQKDVPGVQSRRTMDLSVQCPQCGFITSNDQLKAHLETHNSEETYACEHCPYETKSLDALQRHKGKHIKHKVSLTCVHCGKIQSDILTLRDHTRIHLPGVDNDNLFRCSLCAFTTNSSEDGEYHLNQHNYVMEFKCQVCMYSSPTLSGLTSHRRMHRKLKSTSHTQKKSSPTRSQQESQLSASVQNE